MNRHIPTASLPPKNRLVDRHQGQQSSGAIVLPLRPKQWKHPQELSEPLVQDKSRTMPQIASEKTLPEICITM